MNRKRCDSMTINQYNPPLQSTETTMSAVFPSADHWFIFSQAEVESILGEIKKTCRQCRQGHNRMRNNQCCWFYFRGIDLQSPVFGNVDFSWHSMQCNNFKTWTRISVTYSYLLYAIFCSNFDFWKCESEI